MIERQRQVENLFALGSVAAHAQYGGLPLTDQRLKETDSIAGEIGNRESPPRKIGGGKRTSKVPLELLLHRSGDLGYSLPVGFAHHWDGEFSSLVDCPSDVHFAIPAHTISIEYGIK